jgi:sarcosine oxidase subunit alpha
MSVPKPLARTPLHAWHQARGAHFLNRDGWQVVGTYSAGADEAAAVAGGVGLADVSAFAKSSLRGRDVAALTEALPGAGSATRVGGVALLAAGGPVLACRLTGDHLLLLAENTSTAGLNELLAPLRDRWPVLHAEVTSALASFCLVGPRRGDVLARLTSLDVKGALSAGRCAETNLAGVQALLVAVPDAALPVLRLCVSWDLGEYVWTCLLEAGRDCGITPLGIDTLDHLRAAETRNSHLLV